MSPTLTLRFTRLSPDSHRFEYRRPDGSGEAIEMESEGAIDHDLLHYAVEAEAGLKGSFFGILAKIGGYEELVVAGGAALGGEIAITEIVVGGIRGSLEDDVVDSESLGARIADDLALFDQRSPRWPTPTLVAAARTRAKELIALWRVLPSGEVMELTFDP